MVKDTAAQVTNKRVLTNDSWGELGVNNAVIRVAMAVRRKYRHSKF